MTEREARRQLRALREKRRISCDRLAAEMAVVLGRNTVTPKTLSRFERGEFHPHKHTLADVSEFLQKTEVA
jgi:transcriptional regulator with XRE-family HTH domain